MKRIFIFKKTGKSSRAGNRNFRSRDEIIRTNFDNYGLSPFYWDIMACDSTYLPFRVGEIFDAIVTDRKFFSITTVAPFSF